MRPRPLFPPATPLDEALRRDLLATLHEGLSTLPADQRLAFVALYVDELRQDEAAALLGVPQATVGTRAHRASLKLRAFVEAREGQP